MSPPVIVAVVSWNTRALLERCLRSFQGDAEDGHAAVWVVDNASSDGSADMVRCEFPWVSLVASTENVGFGRAINAVAERTNAPWIAAANADIECHAGALKALLEAGESDSRVGALAPRLLRPDATTQHSVHAFPTVSLSLILNLGLKRVSRRVSDHLCLEGYWNPDRERYVDWAHGALLLLRRAAFEQIGGFDPRQWMYAEDLDLAWRLRRAGWCVRYVPGATAHHEVGAATEQAFADRTRRHMAATYAWMARRRGFTVTRAFALVNVTGTGIRALAFRVLGLLFPGRWRDGRAHARRWLAAHRLGLRSRGDVLTGR